jgi:hypothetical protein
MAFYSSVHMNGTAIGIVAADAATTAAAGTPDFMDDYSDSSLGLTTTDPIEKLQAILHGYSNYHSIAGPSQFDGTASAAIATMRTIYGF